jgi:general stress protein YciG
MDMNHTTPSPAFGDASLPSVEGDPTSNRPAETPTPAVPEPTPKPRARRGFAVMDPKLVSEIARKGGKAAHAAGTAHEFSREEARAAGRKGGLAPHTRRKARRPAGEPPVGPPASPQDA